MTEENEPNIINIRRRANCPFCGAPTNWEVILNKLKEKIIELKSK